MELPVQPPPDAPAPPPGPEALRSRRVALWIFVPGSLLICGLLVFAGNLFLIRGSTANLSEVSGNLRSLSWVLSEFESEYGGLPSASTVTEVRSATGTTAPLGTATANELLRQLVVTVVPSETLFYAPSSVCPKRGDNRLGTGTLAKGECAFAYVAGTSSTGDPGTPILMAPVLPAAKCFERRRDMRRHAVILFRDGSVKALPVTTSGQVIVNGMDLLDPRQPYWGGKAPDIKWPE